MKDLEKLEFIHCAIQEVINLTPDWALGASLDQEMDGELSNALKLVEELREPLLPETEGRER